MAGAIRELFQVNACPKGSFSLDAAAESIALSKLRPAIETHRAELTPKAVETLDTVCRDVLLRVRYPKSPTSGADGTRYHMGHWISGAFLSGTTWSPEVVVGGTRNNIENRGSIRGVPALPSEVVKRTKILVTPVEVRVAIPKRPPNIL